MESGVYAAPIASWVNTVFTRLPFRSISYRLPSSLFAKTMPLPSIPGACTHHSKPNGWSEVQESVPSALRWQLFELVFWRRQLTWRSGDSGLMKYCSGYPGVLAVRSGGQMVLSLQYEPTSP